MYDILIYIILKSYDDIMILPVLLYYSRGSGNILYLVLLI